MLSNARKLPRDYFGSSLLRKPETLRGLLVEELTISSNVSLPDVVVTGKHGAFLEDELDGQKRQQRLGETRDIRQTVGDEHEDAGRGFPERRQRRRTADDAGRDRTGGRVGGTARVGHVQTIGIPEGVAQIEGAEERCPVISLLALAHGSLRVGFRTVVLLAITAPGVPRRRRMVRARMPREARQPLLPAAHAT
jgi:hypothetical protein